MKTLIVMALAFVPGVALAQRSLPAAIDRLDAGNTIRVRTPVDMALGKFSGVSNGSIMLKQDAATVREIGFADVNELWKRSSYARHGAITGGVIGTVALTALGSLFVKVSCEQPDHCRNDYPTVALYSLAIGGGGGALLGAGVGYAVKRWIRLY